MFIIYLFYVISLATAKKTYYCSGKQDGLHYCSYTVGDPDTNIIINAPHGGELRAKDIRRREAGCLIGTECRWEHDCGEKNYEHCPAICMSDHLSNDVAKQLAEDIKKMTGVRPHLTINEVHRAHFDGNREIRKATFGEPAAVKTFHEYHNFIRNATDSVKTPALFLDIHGTRHAAEWFEIGYKLRSKSLDEGTIDPDYSSVRGLFLRTESKYSFKQMIQGNKSLGYLFQKQGYKTVPSPAYPGPGKFGYYPGGWNMMVHASMWNTDIDALQIEIPNYIRTPENVPNISKDIAQNVLQWMKVYYEGDDSGI